MTNPNIAYQRLHHQGLTNLTCATPAEVVRWLGAVQSQDYAAAQWALGLRASSVTIADVEQAFTDGAILRTHVMRPTWHFVTPIDIRWLLALTAPRVNALNAYYYRKFELDDAVFTTSHTALTKALQGGQQLTRPELVATLQHAGITAEDPLRFALIIMQAELAGLVCSGARRGKQFTYALLDERVPPTTPLDRDAALAELARRYFTSHGPATLHDFVWWSGLAIADAGAALTLAASQLLHEVIEGQIYWFAPTTSPAPALAPSAYLLPNYDEYIVGYTDRSAVFDPSHVVHLDARANVLFNHTIVLDGQVVGTWKRTLSKRTVYITPTFFRPPSEAEMHAFLAAAAHYGEFLGLSVHCS